jgi:plastocyanin
MDTLDSRLLSTTDCFGRRFARAGAYMYELSGIPEPCRPFRPDDRFEVEVGGPEAKEGQGRQHDVAVRFEGGRFVADPPQLRISPGDVVLWNAPDPGTPPYAVHGEGEQGFSSAAMSGECVYSHAFGVAGEYEWRTADGGGLRGRVVVSDMDLSDPGECERWTAALEEGTVVMIDGDRADPDDVRILTGQTVFWAIVRGDGITITDERVVLPPPQPPMS